MQKIYAMLSVGRKSKVMSTGSEAKLIRHSFEIETSKEMPSILKLKTRKSLESFVPEFDCLGSVSSQRKLGWEFHWNLCENLAKNSRNGKFEWFL